MSESLSDKNPLERELSEVLEEYLVSLEAGIPLDVEALAAEHPELAGDIRSFAESVRILHQATLKLDGGEHGTTFADAPPEDLATPRAKRILGDFEIGPEIGRGGMGIVYEAWQLSLQRNVALKVLPLAAMWDEKQLARFQHEAQAAARLHHPNIVPVFAVGKERGVHYYAMQLIQGSSLDKLIHAMRDEQTGDAGSSESAGNSQTRSSKKTTNRLGTSELQTQSQLTVERSANRSQYYRAVAQLGIQAATALHYAHECGVVHRDIKPSNLLLDQSNKLWIADFGVARCQDSPGVTVTGDLVGTLRYMSPEQATGRQALVDIRTDVYALGASLYELLTLKPAFPGEERHEVLTLLTERDPPALSQLEPSVPLDLETIILQSMAKAREDRYATAAEFAEDLKRFLEGRPTLARRPTLVDRSSKWVRRHRTLVAVAAMFLVVLTILSGTAAVMLSQEQARTKGALREAEANLQQARLVVDRFGNQFAEKLAQLPGSEPLRQRVLGDTLAYYQDFINRSGDDPSLKEQLAATHFQVGTIAGHLGQIEKAEESYQTAIQLYSEVDAAAADKQDNHLLEIATAWNNFAVILASQGKAEEAKQHYRAALQQLPQNMPVSRQHLSVIRLQAEIQTNLALLDKQLGNFRTARRSITAAIHTLETILATFPDSTRSRHDLALALNNRTFIEQETDLAAAQGSCVRALELFQAIVDSEETDALLQAERRADLALCYNNLAAIQGHQNENQQAVATYQQAIRIQQQLVRQFPHVIQYRCNLAITWNNLGQAWSRCEDLTQSEESQIRAEQLFTELVDDFPADARYRSSLAGVLNNRAMIAMAGGSPAKAIPYFESAIEHQSTAILQAPRQQYFREFLSKHYANYSHALVAVGRIADAVNVALKRRELWPNQGDHLFGVAGELGRLAEQLEDDDERRAEVLNDAVKTLQRAASAGANLEDLSREKPLPALLRERLDLAKSTTARDHS